MTGSGTQENPYIVSTWEELENLPSSSSKRYIEIADDIYMNDERPEGISVLQLSNVSIDGKGHSIHDLYVPPDSAYALRFTTNACSVSNLNFSDIYSRASNGVLSTDNHTVTFTNCQFDSVIQSGFLVYPASSGRITCDQCAFTVKMNSTDIHTTGRGTFELKNSILHVLGDCVNARGLLLNNSLLTGDKIGSLSLHSNSEISVIDIAVTESLGTIGSTKKILINKDKVNNDLGDAAEKGYLAVTSEEMRDAEYLSSLGFPIGVD